MTEADSMGEKTHPCPECSARASAGMLLELPGAWGPQGGWVVCSSVKQREASVPDFVPLW